MTEISDDHRAGSFWDGVMGRAPIPPAARTLGLEIVEADPAGSVEVAFTATEKFTNPAGNVLGAFLAAMLYDTVGPALLSTLAPDEFQSTMEMHTSFLRPVRPGRITGRGRLIYRVGDIAFLEAVLTTGDGSTIAAATATARVIALVDAPAAA